MHAVIFFTNNRLGQHIGIMLLSCLRPSVRDFWSQNLRRVFNNIRFIPHLQCTCMSVCVLFNREIVSVDCTRSNCVTIIITIINVVVTSLHTPPCARTKKHHCVFGYRNTHTHTSALSVLLLLF